jgi:hypothetical protein
MRDSLREIICQGTFCRPLSNLTGGKNGSASKVIGWLIQAPAKEIEEPAIQTDAKARKELEEIADKIEY